MSHATRPCPAGSTAPVSVVLPTYNESGNIGPLMRRLDELIAGHVEIIVVDDASPDGTAQEAEAVAAELAHSRVIVRDQRGLTAAIQRGIDESRGDVVVWMDCDFSMPPETVPELIARVAEGADAAIGSRYVAPVEPAPNGDDGTWPVRLQKLLTRRLNRAMVATLATDVHDWTSGFIAIRGSLIRSLRLDGEHGEYFIDLMASLVAMRARLTEVSYRTEPRRHGASKTAPGLVPLATLGWKYLRAFATARRTIRNGGDRAATPT